MKAGKLPYGLRIIYEDGDILAIDKPSGLLTIAAGSERDRTAYWILSEYLRKRTRQRVAVVHRLDRDTSGVMIFAKSGEIKQNLMSAWAECVEQRIYIAVAEGCLPTDFGRIDAPLGSDARGCVLVMQGGLPAVTYWEILRAARGYSLLKLHLETGRRNQIRAHLDWLGHPIAGDKKYSSKANPIGRLALHAQSLVLSHPRTGKSLNLIVPEPQEFLGLFR